MTPLERGYLVDLIREEYRKKQEDAQKLKTKKKKR